MLVDDVPSVQQSDTMPDDVPDDSTDDSGAGLTQEICDFVADLDLSAIPEDVIARGRIHMLDSMGLALAGGASPVCRILGHYAIRNAAKGAAAVYATGDRYAPAMAALINGTAMHADNFDDTAPQPTPDRNGGIHASAGVLAAALAAAEAAGADGPALSVAFHAGCEIACKLNHAIDQRHYQGGFHVTSTLGVFGAAVAAAKIMGLGPAEIGNALTFASSRSAGVRSTFGTMVEQMHTGLAAEGGVVAAELAKDGLIGNGTIFEAPSGFMAAAGGGFLGEAIIGRLGTPWAIIDPGTSIKPWPNGSLVHPAMTLFADMIGEHGLTADTVEHVTVRTNQRIARTLIGALPQDSMQARFSIPFALAVLLIEGRAGIDAFTDAMVCRPDIVALMGRIDHVAYEAVEDGFTNVTSFVEVTNTDGTIHNGRADFALGSAQSPMSYDDIADKTRGCAAAANWPVEKTEALIAAIARIEEISDVREVTALLAG
jgi:2-methylcitrate dehydratase PrpD